MSNNIFFLHVYFLHKKRVYVKKEKMEKEVAKEYYELTKLRKETILKRKRLQYEHDTQCDGPVKRMTLVMALNMNHEEERQNCLAMARLKEKYEWKGDISGVQEFRRNAKEKIAKTRKLLQQDWRRSREANEKLNRKISYYATILRDIPMARPLFAIPAVTLPLAFHPNVEKLYLDTGALHADIWREVIRFYYGDFATLRILRLTCVSMAIVIHSLPAAVTHFYFCV